MVKSANTTDVDHHQKPIIGNGNSSLANSMLKSGLKPWTCNMGSSDSIQKSENPKCPNAHRPQNPDFDDYGWGYCTEDQLEKILLKNLECLYSEAVSKLVALGYDEEVALKAVLKEGYWYAEGSMDVLTNILHHSLTYLNNGSCKNDGDSDESEFDFTTLRQLVEDCLADMVRLLRKFRPQLSRGDALWCLLMSDLDLGRASTLEIPMLPSSNVCSNTESDNDSVNTNATICGISVPHGLYKFHESWDLPNGAKLKPSANGFGGFFSFSESSIQRDIGCPRRLNLSPTMKSLLKRNVAAFAAGFLSKQQLQMDSQPCISCATSVDSSEGTTLAADSPAELVEESCDNNQDAVNSILNNFKDLDLDENLNCVAEDQKDELILTLVRQVNDLEKQVKERKEWAHQKALQAAKKLSNDLTELKILRMEREDTHRLKKGKQTLEDKTMKRLSEMETALRTASSQVDRANAAVRHLEIENAEIRAEMEASKLSASESMKACLEVAKREKKCLKRLLTWEKQKTKLQEEMAAEKQKISDLQLQLVQINAAQKDAQEKWRHEVKEKEIAMARVEEERHAKESSEGNSKRKLETLRLRIEIDFQRQKDDLRRLEQELARLKTTAQSTNGHDPSDAITARSPEAASHQGEAIARLLHEACETENESGFERECMICVKEEVSVVFLPCAHQVMCANCGENYGKRGRKATCPCCRVPIEQRIRVFGVTS